MTPTNLSLRLEQLNYVGTGTWYFKGMSQRLLSFFTEGKPRHYGLDLLRTVAIMSVILCHYPRSESQILLRGISHFGYWGVDLFFVLSGFLIGGQCFKELAQRGFMEKRNFYLRRFLRTLPPYYAFLIFVLILGSDSELYSLDWRYLFFLQNMSGLYGQSHTWSLCVEEHFYLIFPFVAVFCAQRSRFSSVLAFFIGIFVFGLILRSVLWLSLRPDLVYGQNVDQGYEIYFQNFYFPTLTRLDGLAIGVMTAFIQYNNSSLWKKLISKGNLRLIQGTALLIVAALLSYYKTEWINVAFSFPLVSVAFALLVLSSQNESSFLNRLRLPGVTLVSTLSYALYLTHLHGFAAAEYIVKQLSLPGFGITAAAIRCLVIVGTATIMFVFIERPSLYLRKKLLNQTTLPLTDKSIDRVA